MRKIERLMNQAIIDHKDFRRGNTEVVPTYDGVCAVYLHGNKIAEVTDHSITLYDGGWQSNTTKSRLNAILTEHGAPSDRVFQKDFQWYVQTYIGVESFQNGVTLT